MSQSATRRLCWRQLRGRDNPLDECLLEGGEPIIAGQTSYRGDHMSVEPNRASRQTFMRLPSTSTVQAPHCPMSQPRLLPVRCSCIRS
jgi:hypothetical protein